MVRGSLYVHFTMAVNVIIQSVVMKTNIAVDILNTRMNKGIDE